MAKIRKGQSIDAGKIEGPIVAPNEEVQRDFEEAARLGSAGRQHMIDKLREHHSTSPKLSGGDVDAAWEDSDVGEESVGGENPTPDQDIVEEHGKAVGLTYEGNEPLHGSDKIEGRDQSRWELDPVYEKPHGRWILGQPFSTTGQRARARLLFCSSRCLAGEPTFSRSTPFRFCLL
jgi:hypothetical protein